LSRNVTVTALLMVAGLTIAQQNLFAASAARAHLLAYSVGQWPGYRPAPHHHLLASKLEAVERGEIRRLIVTMPPRHGKSMLTSEFFPAWYLGRNPDRQVIGASYGQDLASDFGRKVRDHSASPLHRAAFPKSALKQDSQSAQRFNTEAGGAYFAVGRGAATTGRGAHLFLIDDPFKDRAEAESLVIRESTKAWYRAVVRTRLMPGGAIVLVLTRWHADDLAGYVLREHAHEGWEVFTLPAIAEEGDAIGRAEGEALWPSDYPLPELESLKTTLGSYEWAALYQGHPQPREGGLIKLSWFENYRYDVLPANPIRVIQSWDTAQKAEQVNDPSVCQTWLETPTAYYLADSFSKRMEYPELKRTALSLAAKWSPQALLIEDKSSGTSLVQDLKSETKLPVVAIEPDGDKVIRAMSTTALMESGRVWLPRSASWLLDFESVIASFPNGLHDDEVDSMSQALKYLSHGGGATGLLEYYRRQAEAKLAADAAKARA